MDKKKLFSDYIFNIFRLILNIGLPLFVLPFVLNRIGPENYGIFSYTNSIVSYFCMIAVLGIPEYAARAVSRERQSNALGKTVSEILVIQFISVTITLIAFYIVFYPLFSAEYKRAYTILSILIFSNYFNVEWFYTGTQRFKYMSIRGICLKVLNVLALFLFIEYGDDYFKYTLITVLTSLAGGLVNFVVIMKYIQFKNLNIKQHIRPIFLLFSLSVAGLINGSLDKSLTGYLVGPIYVGYYTLGFRISRLVLQLFTALNNIIYPRVMSYLANNDEEQSQKLIGFNMDYILMLSFPIVIGMTLYSKDIISLLFDQEMLPAVSSLVILVFIIPIQAVRRLVRQQILLPRDKDRIILYITIFSILSNIGLNLLLVPRYFHIGAAFATLVVEFLDLISSLIYVRYKFKLNIFSIKQIKYFIASFVVIIPYSFYARTVELNVFSLFLMIFISVLLYFSTLIILRDNLFFKLCRKYIKKII